MCLNLEVMAFRSTRIIAFCTSAIIALPPSLSGLHSSRMRRRNVSWDLLQSWTEAKPHCWTKTTADVVANRNGHHEISTAPICQPCVESAAFSTLARHQSEGLL